MPINIYIGRAYVQFIDSPKKQMVISLNFSFYIVLISCGYLQFDKYFPGRSDIYIKIIS